MSETTDPTDRIARRLKNIEYAIWAVGGFLLGGLALGLGYVHGTIPFEAAITVVGYASVGALLIALLSSPVIQDTARWVVNAGRKRLGSGAKA